MNMRIQILLLLVLFVFSCQKEEIGHNEINESAFYPLEIGAEWTYDVMSYEIDAINMVIDTTSSQERLVATEQWTDSATEQTYYLIDRHVRPHADATWSYDQRLQAIVHNGQAILQEGNFRHVKLELPISNGHEWNGQQYFDKNIVINIGGESMGYYKGWTSSYASTGQSVEIAGNTYDNVTTVTLAELDNKVERRYAQEQYASGVGLIYSDIQVFDTQCFDDCPSSDWLEKADAGHRITKELISYKR